MAVQWIGPYRVVDKIGAGANGDVYLADDPRLRRRVALKRLSDPELTSPEARRLLMREARTAARLNHPNVASVYDVVESDHGVHIVMEYVPGVSLASRVLSGPLPPPTVVAIGIQLADALAEAHAMGVIHRDVKPGNVRVTGEDRVKILDFGLAQTHVVPGRDVASASGSSEDSSTTHGSGDATGVHRIMGTPPYMPPESFLGHPPDERGDIYSLGVTLFEMLTGQRPFKGNDMRSAGLAVVSAPTPHARVLNPDVPASLDAIVARAMARSSSERHGSAAELAADLRRELIEAGTISRGIATLGGRRWPWHRRPALLAAGGLALIALTWTLVPRPNLAMGTPGAAVVAVLPLANATGNAANDYLGAGIADVLISSLARVPGVTMISRSATVAYRQPDRDVGAIARELGADLVVDGVVQAQPSRDTVRVTLSLLRAKSKVVAWSRAYDGAFSEMFALQTEAAAALSQALQVTLTPEDKRRLQSPPTTNVEALAEYAQARDFLERPDVAGSLEHSIALFQSAITRDPRFAAAHAGLGQAYWLQFQRTREGALSERAILETTESLRLDPEESAVHQALGMIYHGRGATQQALEELRRAIFLRPGNDEAHEYLGRVLMELGRRHEALTSLKTAVGLRPNFWKNHYSLGVAYYDAGRFGEAAQSFRRVIELQPDSHFGHYMLGTVRLAQGDSDGAIANLRKAISIAPAHGTYTNLGEALFRKKRYAEAAEAFEEAARRAPKSAFKFRNLGDAYARLGEKAKAREAYARGAAMCREHLKSNPNDARVLGILAVYEAKLGRRADAVEHSRAAVDIGGEMADVLYRRAVVLALVGHLDESAEALRRAVAAGSSRAQAASDEDLARVLARPEFQQMAGDATLVPKGGMK